MFRARMFASAVAIFAMATATASAIVGPTIVDSIAGPGTTASGVWYDSAIQGDGATSLVDLTGRGGNLENNASLPTGAARLSTTLAVADKAQIGMHKDYGKLVDIIDDLSISFDWYKEFVPGGNIYAAPALILGIESPNGSANLVYEPYWQQPDLQIDHGQWVTETITKDYGATDINRYGVWTSGGFGQPNAFGGPPINSLAQWVDTFDDDPNFADARLNFIAVSVGTHNVGQVGYFDNIVVDTGAAFDVFDFEAPTADEAARLVTGSPTTISQLISTPASPSILSFDYSFETTTGFLQVLIDGNLVGQIDAPSSIQPGYTTAMFTVDGALLNLVDVPLEFILDGPTASSILIDDVSFAGLSNGDFANGITDWTPTSSGAGFAGAVNDTLFITSAAATRPVPEPTTALLAVLGIGAMSLRRRRA